MKASTYKNWRKNETNSKTKEVSEVFAVYASKNGNGIEIKFENADGERINFILNEHDTALLLMQIDKNYHGKNVKREDYNLPRY